MQNHWDRLPLELRKYILSLSTWQQIRDRRKNKLLCELLEEINDYGEIKQIWTIGPIKLCLKSSSSGYYTQVLGKRLKASIRLGEYKILGYTLKFAKCSASSIMSAHLSLIEHHPEWFVDQ